MENPTTAALVNDSPDLYAPESLEHVFGASEGGGYGANGSETDAPPVTLGLPGTPAEHNSATQIGARMGPVRLPYRAFPDSHRELLAIRAHLVASATAPRLHTAPLSHHSVIIREGIENTVPEIPPSADTVAALADIADMVWLYADLFLPSCAARPATQPGVDDGLAWDHPAVGVFFDILVAGPVDAEAQVLDPDLAADTRRLLDSGRVTHGERFAGIRIVALDVPDRSLKVAPNGDVYRLTASDLDPWHIEMAQVTA